MESGYRATEREENSTPKIPRHIPSPLTGILLLVSLIVICISAFLVYFELNRVGTCEIKSGKYTEKAQIQKIVGNLDGDFFPGLDTAAIEKKISSLSPMIADVRFELSFPRKLTIRIVDEVYRYSYRTEDGSILLLNQNFKILAFHDQEAYKNGECDYDLSLLTSLYASPADKTEYTLGETLNFQYTDELSTFMKDLRNARGHLYETLNLLDIRNNRNIVFVFDNLVRVVLYESTDFEIKCRSILKMMEKKEIRKNECPTKFTYVEPPNASVYWAVEEWADIYRGYSD